MQVVLLLTQEVELAGNVDLVVLSADQFLVVLVDGVLDDLDALFERALGLDVVSLVLLWVSVLAEL